jgi:hypothetical protein
LGLLIIRNDMAVRVTHDLGCGKTKHRDCGPMATGLPLNGTVVNTSTFYDG